MSTGISISSINRIKELAEEKKFAEALEILDTQNLDKSINPQFLRISGEIFRENKRYYDSRKYLLKAHQMSPQGTRILYELIQLYLELGYYTRAQKYYEQYKFYVAPEDTQQEYLEYLVKKAQGADIKEIAAVLIPILERMPDDRWNFEAILLYDKMGRKDKALEESQYILENFRDSIYVQPVIDYIDDKLDVDKYFNCYPKEEQPEEQEMFGDLIVQEDAILEADYLRMYPPEARIMVEADDKDGIDAKPVKEKKKRKKPSRKKNKEEKTADADDNTEQSTEVATLEQTEQAPADVEQQSDTSTKEMEKPAADADSEQHSRDEASDKKEESAQPDADKAVDEEAAKEQQKNEREAALEKILSKKVDKEKILETAKHVAQSVKDIDTSKAKTQVKNVADVLKDNVAKATGTLSDAVGAKMSANAEEMETLSDEFVDGIIESVLEPPKKTVGEVITNEELDALIPDSLEAMSADEIADIEAKKEEEERIELEALEASMRLEEEKKESRLRRWSRKDSGDDNTSGDAVIPEEVVIQDGVTAQKIASVSFEELKAQFLADNQEEEPLDTLGFMSVVQSDVDSRMKEDIPQEAEILHQMIDNKEYYSGEDSGQFESKVSYEKNDFVVEDYTFDTWKTKDTSELSAAVTTTDEKLVVQDIYAEEPIVDFEEIIPSLEVQIPDEKNVPDESVSEEHAVMDEPVGGVEEQLIPDEPVEVTEEQPVLNEPVEVVEEHPILDEAAEVIEEASATEEPDAVADEPEILSEPEELVAEPMLQEESEEAVTEPVLQEEPEDVVTEPVLQEESEESVTENSVVMEAFDESTSEEEPVMEQDVTEEPEVVPENKKPDREELRIRIIIREDMIRKLSELKESRC